MDVFKWPSAPNRPSANTSTEGIRLTDSEFPALEAPKTKAEVEAFATWLRELPIGYVFSEAESAILQKVKCASSAGKIVVKLNDRGEQVFVELLERQGKEEGWTLVTNKVFKEYEKDQESKKDAQWDMIEDEQEFREFDTFA